MTNYLKRMPRNSFPRIYTRITPKAEEVQGYPWGVWRDSWDGPKVAQFQESYMAIMSILPMFNYRVNKNLLGARVTDQSVYPQGLALKWSQVRDFPSIGMHHALISISVDGSLSFIVLFFSSAMLFGGSIHI